MYLVPVEIKESKINGKGVFAVEKITQGQVVWQFDANHDKVMSKKEFDILDDISKTELKRVAYLSPTTNQYVYPPENDAARFTNHNLNNNLSVRIDTTVSKEPYFFANTDIQIGEELTNNYLEFDKKIKFHAPHWL